MAWPTASSRSKNWTTEILTDADLEAQLDLLHSYFNDSLNGTTGHGHTGGTNDGPKLSIATALTVASQAQGDIIYASSSSAFARLGVGTSGQVLKTQGAAANPAWTNSLSSVLDYGTSASASTAKQGTATMICFGKIDINGTSTQAITNLPFTSAATFVVMTSFSLGGSLAAPGIVNDSGAQFTITNNVSSTKTYYWLAIGS